MRTTVEMKPEHRDALLALAAQRGLKGFSAVLEEAIANYLIGEREREQRRTELLAMSGTLTQEEAADVRQRTGEIRESWR